MLSTGAILVGRWDVGSTGFGHFWYCMGTFSRRLQIWCYIYIHCLIGL